MAREIVAWCDVCRANGEDTRGRTVSITIDAAIPVGLDLCDAHESEHLTVLRTLLSKYGAPINQQKAATPAKPSAQSPVPCYLCDESRSTIQSLAGHLDRDHSLRLIGSPTSAYFGRTCPLCNGGPFEALGTGHAIGMHPDVSGAAGLFALAESKGDPFGVIRQNTARLRAAIGKELSADD